MAKWNPLDNPICLETPLRLTPVSSWHQHMPFAMLLIDLLRPQLFVELGTHNGDSYCAFCQAVKKLTLSTKCYAIDSWQGDPHSGFYGPDILSNLRAYHDPLYGSFSSLIQNTFDVALQNFTDETIDILHIDGYHNYEAVKNDFESWLPKVSPHGLILFHDINSIREDFGVSKFWNEIKPLYPHFEFLHSEGLGVLLKSTVPQKELQWLFRADNEETVKIRNFFSQLASHVTISFNEEAKGHEIDDQKRQYARLESSLKESRSRLRKLNAALQTKDSQIAELSSTLQSKVSQIRNLEFNMQQMQRGIVMQLLKRYQLAVGKIFPTGTQRRHLYELVLKGIRVIVNEGWRSFHFKVRQWFRQRINLQTNADQIPDPYQKWIERNEPKSDDLKRQKQESMSFKYRPKISIIIPVWNPEPKWLRANIESVINQTYTNWELCMADGNSTNPLVKQLLKKYAKRDLRIKIIFLPKNRGISGNSNEALALATGEYIALLDHDDELRPHALYEVVKSLNEKGSLDFIYSDEDKIDSNEHRVDPFFKPDWSPDLFMSMMYTCHFCVIRTDLVNKIGGFREEFEGSQDYDLVLRVTEKTNQIGHIPKVLYSWRKVTSSAATSYTKTYAYASGLAALQEALKRRDLAGDVFHLEHLGCYRIRYKIKSNPLVSIIIPNLDHIDDLRKCVSTLLKKSTYNNYEIIIVDTGSSDKQLLAYYRDLQKKNNIKLLEFKKPFNYSSLHNFAVQRCNGEFLILLNNDTEIIADNWIEELLMFCQRNDVGAVGAKLIYPDGKIQHAGVILGLGGVAGHSHKYYPTVVAGYMNSLLVARNYSAVTAACMMTKKNVFNEVGGFDENLKLAFNDVDFCLKIREKNYLIVWTPFAELYHHESKTRGYEDSAEKQARFTKEIKYMMEKWKPILEKDPYYNPNLTLDKEDFSISI